MATTEPTTAPTDPDTSSPTIHHWCCYTHRSICGIPIENAWIDTDPRPTPDECVVCLDLIEAGIECSPGCNQRNGITP